MARDGRRPVPPGARLFSLARQELGNDFGRVGIVAGSSATISRRGNFIVPGNEAIVVLVNPMSHGESL
jgi:hypothetical protein